MNPSDTPVVRTTSRKPTNLLIFIEWISLLCAVILCLPSEGYYPGLGLALVMSGISWIARWVRIRCLTRATALDIPLLIFLLNLFISYSVAPDFATAFTRLSLFLVAISFFYALVNSPSRNLNLILNLFVIVLAFASLIFIAQVDWSLEPPRFSLTKLIGIQLNRMIPNLGINLPPWNVLRNILASVLGLSLPILLLQLYRAFTDVRRLPGSSQSKQLSWLKLGLLILTTFLIILALILTESRTPWLVFTIMLMLAAWWWLSRQTVNWIRISHLSAFLAEIVLVALFLVVINSLLPQDVDLISLLPGPDTLTGRMEIYPQSIYLVEDTPYTGGGLGAFTALYSYNIRVIPFNAFTPEDTGNNLYLYILVEQGWLGLVCLSLLIVIPLYVGLVNIDHEGTIDKGFIVAGLAGVGFITLWGFFHAMLAASRAIPFLLLPAGLIFAGSGSTNTMLGENFSSLRSRLIRSRTAALVIPLLLLLAYLLIAPAPRSAWYANLGAVNMARVQLAGWPTGVWEDGSSLPSLAPAEALFQKSLAMNTHNRTANHRLGLIAMLRQDFSSATQYLEVAYQVTPKHRGIIKSLGYALVWNGEIARAIELLRMIPEASQEMDVYIWWWNTLDRPDLSDRAMDARDRLLIAP